MAKASLDGAVEWTKERLRGNLGLLATVALALIGVPAMLAQVVQAVAPKEPVVLFGVATEQMALTPGDWVALVLLGIAVLLGTLTVARMLMMRGETVRQSLDRAGRQLPMLLGALLLFALGLAVIAAGFIGVIAVVGSLGTVGKAIAAVLTIAALVFLLVLVARMSLLTPSAVEGDGPITLLRRAIERGRGSTLKLIVLTVLTTVVGYVVAVAVQLVVGIPIALAAGRQAGVIAGAAAAGLAYSLTALITLALLVGFYLQTGSGVDEGDVRGD